MEKHIHYQASILPFLLDRIEKKISPEALSYLEGKIVSLNGSLSKSEAMMQFGLGKSIDINFNTERFRDEIGYYRMTIRLSQNIWVLANTKHSQLYLEEMMETEDELLSFVDEFCEMFNKLFSAFLTLDEIKVKLGIHSLGQLRMALKPAPIS